MGLDQYAYVAARAGQQKEFYDSAVWDENLKEYVDAKVAKPREIAYWRKHPNLHGWMRDLYHSRGGSEIFNCIELELTWDDIDRLEQDIRNTNLPETQGFFFGDSGDDYYREQDLEFCRNARADLFCGLKVFYNSSW